MDKYLLREYLAAIEHNPVPERLDPQTDPETGLLKWVQLIWSPRPKEMLRFYIFCNRSQVLLEGTQRLWVPLQDIRITGAMGMSNPPAIGYGGWYCISFSNDRTGPVDGIKEAFSAALAAAEAAA